METTVLTIGIIVEKIFPILLFLIIFCAGFLTSFLFRKTKKIRRLETLDKHIQKLQSEKEQLLTKTKSAELLASVAVHTESSVFIADENGEIQWVNPGFTNLTGYTLEKFKKSRGSTIMEASCHPEIINIINEALKLKKSITYETHAFTKNCRKIFLSSLLTPIFDENGYLKRLIVIDTDISKYISLKEDFSKVSQELSNLKLKVA